MLSLSQGLKQNREAGEPIYNPFQSLQADRIHIRRGTFSLISAGPGTGKSAFVQALLQRGDDHGNVNRTLYFSADTDASTMFIRSAAIATGWTTEEVEDKVRARDDAILHEWVRARASHMVYDYSSSPDEQHVLDTVEAYLTVWGAMPEVIVMDNLKNLIPALDTGGEFGDLEAGSVFLHQLARDTGAAVIALHHVIGQMEGGSSAIPLTGVRGKVSKTPELILTLYRTNDLVTGTSNTHISPVKNRSGKADPSGIWHIDLHSDLARMKYEG